MVDLLHWLAALPPEERDARLDARLGISSADPSAPGEHLVGYHAASVAPIVHALLEAPVCSDDIFIDLGAGLGKVILLAKLLTGAKTRGVEVQGALVAKARLSAQTLNLDVEFIHADAREAPLDDGTVFFLYTPFTGPVLDAVLERLHAVAQHHAITVCALGFELDAPWLQRRTAESFWLTIYDSAPRTQRHSHLEVAQARAIAREALFLGQ